jgi:hypothetical protein
MLCKIVGSWKYILLFHYHTKHFRNKKSELILKNTSILRWLKKKYEINYFVIFVVMAQVQKTAL